MDSYVNISGYEILRKTTRDGRVIRYNVLVAENMFGGALPEGMHVHHLDENKTNNSESNLMICSHPYHRIQHQRLNAEKASGKSWWRKCFYCKQYDHPKNLYISPNKQDSKHRTCHAAYNKNTMSAYRALGGKVNE